MRGFSILFNFFWQQFLALNWYKMYICRLVWCSTARSNTYWYICTAIPPLNAHGSQSRCYRHSSHANYGQAHVASDSRPPHIYTYIKITYYACMYLFIMRIFVVVWGLVTNGKWRKHTNNYNKKWKFSHLPIISSSWVGDAQKHTNRCIECTLWLQSSFRMKAAYFDVCIMDLRHIFVCEYGYSIWYINICYVYMNK